MAATNNVPRASDFMSRRVRVVTPEMSLAKVVCFMLKHEITNAPVVEKRGPQRRLVGFISERDCLEHLSNEAFFGNPCPPKTVGTIMKAPVVSVAPETDLFTLVSMFTQHGYAQLPVEEDGCLVGIVSRHCMLKALERYYSVCVKSRSKRRIRRSCA